jgi:hypothetical protein
MWLPSQHNLIMRMHLQHTHHDGYATIKATEIIKACKSHPP